MRTAWLPGVAAAAAIAAVATLLGSRVPVVGAPVFAIAIGACVALCAPRAMALEPGIRFASKTLLQWSIVLLGAHLNLLQVARGGVASLPVMLGTFVAVLGVAYVLGRALRLHDDLRRLLAVGTAICGGSAIAALSSVIEADPADVAYALAAIFFFNVIAVLVFPIAGHAMHLSQAAFGLWAGTAINDTSSVVAAGYSYGHEAGNAAVIVKLTRVVLIVPVVLFYAWRRARGASVLRSAFPWFVLWFLAAAALNSAGAVPAAAQFWIAQVGLGAITVALAAVGLSTDGARIRSAGVRPLLLGGFLWLTIALTSLAIAALLHYA